MKPLYSNKKPQLKGILFDEREGCAIMFHDLKMVAIKLGARYQGIKRTIRTKRLYMGIFTAYRDNVPNATKLEYIKPLKKFTHNGKNKNS